MKTKWDVMVCMLFFLLLSEVACCDSSYIEMRLVSRKNVRDMARNFDRFGSLERIRLRSYRTLYLRKIPSISNSGIHTNEAGSAIKNAPQNFNSLNFNRIDLNGENPTTRRISNLRLGSRLIGEPQPESSTKLRNVIAKAHLSNLDITTEKSQKKVTHLTRDCSRNDRRVTNGIEHRFYLPLRENRLREKLRSRRSIVSPQYNTERRTTKIPVRNADFTNLTPINLNDASEIRQPTIGSRKEHVLTIYNRNVNRKNVIQGSSDRKETILMKSRYNTKNARSSMLFESFPEHQFHRRQSELRRERNSLVSRRKLKIPDDEGIRSEDSRQVRRNVRNRVVRDTNIEETTQNRRNVRGFRGRIEKRNAVDERRDNSVRVKVPFLNKRMEFSYQMTSNVESFMRNAQRFFMYRVNKVSRHRHFSHTGKENSLYSRVSRVKNDFDSNIRQDSEGQIIREIRKFGDRARSTTFNRARRFTMKIENSAMERSSLNKERRRLPNRLNSEPRTLVNDENKHETRFSRAGESYKAVRNRERHTLTTSLRKPSVRNTKNTKQFIRNEDKTFSISTISVSSNRFSIQIGDKLAEETSRQIRNGIVSNRRVGDRMRFITNQLRVQSKSVIRILVAQFLGEITRANNFNRFDRNSRNSDTRNKITFLNHLKIKVYSQQLNRRVAVRRQREIAGEYRGIFNERFRSANENYNRVRNQLKEIKGFSKNDVRNARFITEREIRTTHRNREDFVNSKQQMKIKSLSTLNVRNNFKTVRNTAFNDVRSKNRRLLKNSYFIRISAQSASKSYGFKQSNASEKLCTSTNTNTKHLINKMAFTKNSIRLSTSERIEQHELMNLPILKSYNQARWTLHEYISQKKSCILSFVFNILLGLSAIVAMSEDNNKGFTSRLKNQFRNSIFKHLKVG